MLPGGQQRLPVVGYPEGMPLGPSQRCGGQHDVIAANAGRAGEGEGDTAHRSQRHVEQVAAVDAKFSA